MSNVLKIVGIGCGGCLVVLVAAAVIAYSMLPDTMHVERSIVIDAPVEIVFPMVDTPQRWPEWDPWAKLDPDMERSYEGPPAGAGAISRWTSEVEEVGSGSFEILESVPGDRIVFDLHLMGGEMNSTVKFTFKPVDTGLRVTWANDGELDSFGMRLFGVVADMVLGPTFYSGLQDLKQLAEKESAARESELEQETPSSDPVESTEEAQEAR